ncbi:MAG: hypothetical protein QW559_00425 [Candidatus Woesearchaeota archaeon]
MFEKERKGWQRACITYFGIILFFVLLSKVVLAESEKVLNFDFIVMKNGSAQFSDARVSFGTADQPSSLRQDWSIRFGNYFSYIPLVFVLYKDPPVLVDSLLVSKKLPYTNNTGVLEVAFKNKTVLAFDLVKLCDGDSFCEEFENALSCPSDCPLDRVDELCIPAFDGICDPDCIGSLDTDCIEKQLRPSPLTGSTIMLVLIAAVILFVIAFLFHYMRRRKDTFK